MTHARRTQGRHPPSRRGGVHRDRPAGGLGRSRAAPRSSVSSATVRNDMAALEQEGYLRQPHTSAGRVPTEKGYRFFVDTPGRAGRSSAAPQAQQVRSFFAQAHGELEQLLHDTSRLLSDLTDYAAVVIGPGATRRPRSARCSSSGSRPAPRCVVVVLSNGVVEKHTVELDRRHRRRAAGRRHRRTSPRTSSAPTVGALAGARARPPATPPPTPSVDRGARRAAPTRRRRRRAGLRRRHRPDGRRRSTPSTPSARCSSILEQQYVVVSAAARRARPRPAGRHRLRDRPAPAGRVLARRGALRGRGRARPAPSACSARPA